MIPNEHYLVDVIGFNEVERSMLSSIFALAARRDPSFAQYRPGKFYRTADLYLVDADQGAAFDQFRALQRRAGLPAVLVGTSSHGTAHPVLARPLQWARVLEVLDETLTGGKEPSVSALVPIGAGIQPDPAAMRRMLRDTVLVVDDNVTVRAFMQAKLASYGFEVDFAETGEEAIGLSGSREYACVFLDVVLPGIDGYQVCKLIRSNRQAMKKAAVVMLTSRSSPFDKLRGSLAGCDEYLTKPLDENRLLEVIAKFLPSARQKHKERAASGSAKAAQYRAASAK